MGIQVSNLNNKFRLPLTWRLDGRAPQFHLYKEDSPNPDSGSIRTDLPLFSRCSEGPDSDVITNATTRGKRKLRRARKKFRNRSSRCDLSSSSDSDERSFGLNEDDIDRYLAQSSLEYPGNIPIVICSTCILYQTKLSGCQEEIPLQLGLIVNAIFKNHNWIYIQTPHCEEGYVFYKHCIPLCVLPTKRKHLASRTADILANLQELHRSKRGCFDNLEGLHRTDTILANRTATADSILGNTEQLHRSSGCLDNLEELHRSRGCSDEHILDWNGNHVLGEDVFDHLNGYENGKYSQRATDGDFTGNPTEGPYSIESFNRNPTEGPYSIESVTAGNINESIDVQDNGAVEHSSKGIVGNKRISRDIYDPWRNCGLETADLKESFEQPRFGDAERPRSDSSFTDGGYFFDDIVNTELLDANQRGQPETYCLSFGDGRNVVDLCDNRQFGELEGYMRSEDIESTR
ncbi:hypothetical protein M8J77_018352 [Diaphorina citri]|nr:hypothetical protein M8J77_018352 [Diaphorina citri]